MWKEFKDFVLRGNLLDLAAAVIIAGAFGAVVTSFTNDIVMPPIGQLLGGTDFTKLSYELQPEVKDAAGAVTQARVAINYGTFFQRIIDFLIIAFVIFMVVKAYNRMKKEEPAPAPAGPTTEELLTQIRDLLKR